MNQKKKKLYKRIFKKSPEELEQYMQFKRRGSRIENKKGKGSYQRNFKHKNQDFWNYLVPSTRGLSHQPFTLKSSVQIRLGSPCGIAAYCERGWICKLNYHRRNQISRLVSLQPSWRRAICGFVICNRNSNKENESKLTFYSLVEQRSARLPVTRKIAGSNPVEDAMLAGGRYLGESHKLF